MSVLFELSNEHQHFCSLMKCPLCNQFPIVPNYFQGNGRKIARNVAISSMDILAVAQCPKCKRRWSVFSQSQSNTSNPPKRTTTEPIPSQLENWLEVSEIQLIETNREEQHIGSDRRIIDNSKSAGRLTRKLTLSKEWSKTYGVDFEKAIQANGESGFKLFNLIDIKANIQGELRKKYSISESIKNTYTDEVSVEIEAYTKVLYCFKWKLIWQNGVIKCLDRNNREVAFIPFQVASGVTFDILSE